MGGWTRPVRRTGCSRERAYQGSQSQLPVMGSRRIEFELRDRVGGGEIEGRGLIEREFALGRTASGRDAGMPLGQIEMDRAELGHGFVVALSPGGTRFRGLSQPIYSPLVSGNHPSIGGSWAHSFVRLSRGASPIPGDSGPRARTSDSMDALP